LLSTTMGVGVGVIVGAGVLVGAGVEVGVWVGPGVGVGVKVGVGVFVGGRVGQGAVEVGGTCATGVGEPGCPMPTAPAATYITAAMTTKISMAICQVGH
jgi:hypothetical protein